MKAIGKIAQLPAKTREALNRRLHDGQPASVILPWLNALPEVQEILKDRFEAEPVSEQNLSLWRNGGFTKWVKEQEQILRTRERALYSVELAKASGGNLAQGALDQLTGEIFEMVEELAQLRESGQEINPKVIQAVNKSLVAARAKELETQDLALRHKLAEQKDRSLDLAEAQYQLRFVAAFEEHAKNAEAIRLATDSTLPKEIKTEQLRLLLFGPAPVNPVHPVN
jgi:hypothetical protein